MDREREEKTPGSWARGKTLKTRGVDLRACALKVEGNDGEAWHRAGSIAKRFVAHLAWSAEHDPKRWQD